MNDYEKKYDPSYTYIRTGIIKNNDREHTWDDEILFQLEHIRTLMIRFGCDKYTRYDDAFESLDKTIGHFEKIVEEPIHE